VGRREQGRGNAQLKPARAGPVVPVVVPVVPAVPSRAGAAAAAHWAEERAAQRLSREGWRVLARNYRLRGGELDLVCEDEAGVVVIVEVKQRRNAAYGGAAYAIDARKLTRLRRTAAHFLAYGLKRPDARMRFDAVLITGSEADHQFVHLRDVA